VDRQHLEISPKVSTNMELGMKLVHIESYDDDVCCYRGSMAGIGPRQALTILIRSS
jgi:hypothetical protein